MTRATIGNKSQRKHKKILKKAKGYFGARSKTFRCASRAVIKAEQYKFRDRKVRKREFRKLWITRINAAARACGTNYSKFMKSLKDRKITFNRKVLADLSVLDYNNFKALIN